MKAASDVIRRRCVDGRIERTRIKRKHRVRVGDALHEVHWMSYKDSEGNNRRCLKLTADILKEMVRRVP